MTTNRPPSCDLPPEFYKTFPKLKPCPFCGSHDVEIRDGYGMDALKVYVRCNKCEMDGPWDDTDEGHKWNSIPRRSEVLELIRLVDEVTGWENDLIDTNEFSERCMEVKMSCNKPPKTLWVRPVKPTTDDTPAKWPSGDQATLAYTQRKAHCISYIEPAQFIEEVERRADEIDTGGCGVGYAEYLAMKIVAKEIMEGKL